MDVTENFTCTLRAEAHHPPCVMESAGFCTEHSAKARGIGYEVETSPTLRAGTVPAAVALENHPTDSRVKISEDGKVQTLTSRMGTGGNNVPLVLKILSGCEGGGKGPLIQKDKSATLATGNDQTLFQPICSFGHDERSSQMSTDGISDPLTSSDYKQPITVAYPYQEVTGCLSSGAHAGSYNGQDAYNDMLITEKRCYGICSDKSNSMLSSNPNSGIYEASTSRTLDLNGGNPNCNQGGIAVCEPVNYSESNTGPSVVQRIIRWIVRRLTPLECERLQGFPDGWTDIGEWVDSKGKKHKEADSPRYKALGNSIALPFWYWMFLNMAKYLPENATLGSLFDGIGGFPLAWESIHGRGTARWASEIEEFPIAVTKLRFPEGNSGEEQ